MNIDNRWFVLIAIAAIAATVATGVRRRHHRAARRLEHKRDLRSWENEGGNLAPARVAPNPT